MRTQGIREDQEMVARLDMDWQFRGLEVVRLENELLCVDALAELGGKIWNLVHRPTGHNLLWHNPRVAPARQTYGARFDDCWSGGWDELIPNDVPVSGAYGDLLPDHGEVWSQPATVEILENTEERLSVRFGVQMRVLPALFQKTISLSAGASHFVVDYHLENCGHVPFSFLWNIHPALNISPMTRLDIPARTVIPDPWGNGRLEAWSRQEWPRPRDRSGKPLDLRTVPEPSDYADFVYLPDVAEGWYAVTDIGKQIGFGLAFPTSVFPHLWLFRALGGWRALYTLIVEASTGYPNDLAVAREHGKCACLQPGQSLEASVTATVYTGITAVERIKPDGQVIAGER
jgi:hypothetical protein